MAAPVHFSKMRSAVDHDEIRSAAHRVDPFFHDLFVSGSQAGWLSRGVAERRHDDGVVALSKKEMEFSVEEAERRVLRGDLLRERRLAALGSISMWRALNRQQIDAFIGATNYRDDIGDAPLLWSAGLLERGTMPTFHRRPVEPLPWLYRLGAPQTVEAFLRKLPFSERVAVTAGVRPNRGPQHDRHNVLAAELALRVAEFCDIGTVLGESVCGHHFFDPDIEESKGSGSADAALVRTDGLKLLVEMSATSGGIDRKVARWRDIIISSLQNNVDPDFVVVFVEARQQSLSNPRATWEGVQSALISEVANHPLCKPLGLARFFAAVRWVSWFPESMSAEPEFESLPALMLTGNEDRPFSRRYLLDVVDVAGPGRESSMDVLANAKDLLGVPSWMRDGSLDESRFQNSLCARFGFDPPDPTRLPSWFE